MNPKPTLPTGPADLRELFFAFNRLALQGFGGVLAVAQRDLVEYRQWLTREEFLEVLAISQVLPGPNVVNLSLIYGDRCFGLRGAFVALAGMLVVPLVLVLALASAYAQFDHLPVVAGALRGMGAVAAGLVLATAVKLIASLKTNRMGPWLCAVVAVLTFVLVAWLRLPLVWVVCGLGSLAVAAAWRALRP